MQCTTCTTIIIGNIYTNVIVFRDFLTWFFVFDFDFQFANFCLCSIDFLSVIEFFEALYFYFALFYIYHYLLFTC
jgi:hypothetical protein